MTIFREIKKDGNFEATGYVRQRCNNFVGQKLLPKKRGIVSDGKNVLVVKTGCYIELSSHCLTFMIIFKVNGVNSSWLRELFRGDRVYEPAHLLKQEYFKYVFASIL